MNLGDKKSALIAFGATLLVGIVSDRAAQAQTCQCMKTSETRVVGPHSFFYLGSASAGYETDIPSDTNYGFGADTAPTIYFDYVPPVGPNPITTSIQICRISYSGVSQACSPVLNDVNPANASAPRDVSINAGTATGGVWGSAYVTPWDRFKGVNYGGFLPSKLLDWAHIASSW